MATEKKHVPRFDVVDSDTGTAVVSRGGVQSRKAVVQLEQGLASGELRGEERRSVIENLLDAEEAQDGD